MSKSHEEIAAEIVQSVVEARGRALSGMGGQNAAVGANHLNTLSTASVASLYKEVLSAIKSSN
jgi:glycerol dehydrogenase-like iron-containing ADH family enzyme